MHADAVVPAQRNPLFARVEPAELTARAIDLNLWE